MEFLARSWSVSALEVSKAIAPPHMVLAKTLSGSNGGAGAIPEDIAGEIDEGATVSGNPFSFASSETSQMVMDRIMSQSVSEKLAKKKKTNNGISFVFIILLLLFWFSEVDWLWNLAFLCFSISFYLCWLLGLVIFAIFCTKFISFCKKISSKLVHYQLFISGSFSSVFFFLIAAGGLS